MMIQPELAKHNILAGHVRDMRRTILLQYDLFASDQPNNAK